MKNIDVKSLKDKIDSHDDYLVVDVRSEGEFDEVRMDVQNIINIDVNTILHHVDKIPDGVNLYLICNSGNRSGVAQMLLSTRGIESINVDDGMMGWLQSGFPVKSQNQ